VELCLLSPRCFNALVLNGAQGDVTFLPLTFSIYCILTGPCVGGRVLQPPCGAHCLWLPETTHWPKACMHHTDTKWCPERCCHLAHYLMESHRELPAVYTFSAVGIATGYEMDGLGSIPGNAKYCLLHSVQTGYEAHPASYPMGTGNDFPVGKAVRGVKLTTHLHLVPRSRMVELYLYSLICLHGVVLNWLSKGTTLPFCFYLHFQ
jgi:hypothetical protein